LPNLFLAAVLTLQTVFAVLNNNFDRFAKISAPFFWPLCKKNGEEILENISKLLFKTANTVCKVKTAAKKRLGQ
jgi:hypothetical protein